MPKKLFGGGGVFACQCIWHEYGAKSSVQILLVNFHHMVNLLLKVCQAAAWQRNPPMLSSLAVDYLNGPMIEINVFYPQANALD
ncbi:hypothetical protein AB833_02300 [Chromatiales bacterium (ex Bugula neritina AB1)]|nr:hypothetical protein AB833_02300 [Chromatiales bacterium (ex Bugula neritina AB1)]